MIMKNNPSKQKLLENAAMEPAGGNRLLRLCGLLSAQVMAFVIAYEVYNLLSTGSHGARHFYSLYPRNGIDYNSTVQNNFQQLTLQKLELEGLTVQNKSPLTVERLEDFRSYPDDPRMQIWFFEHVFEHPQAELVVLKSLELDGAAPILSTIPPRERDITLATQTSADRLMAVEMTARTWGGEMVVAVHVGLRNETPLVYRRFSALHKRVEALGRCRLSIYFALEEGFETPEEVLQAQYPVNAMRNVALGMVKTQLVFLLDADFVPNTGLHESLTEDEDTYLEIVRRTTEQRQLLVTPAFEPVTSTPSSTNTIVDREDSGMEIPTTKSELLKGWRNGTIDCFHCARSPICHMSTNFEKYFDPATSTSPYTVRYREFFEPYLIAAKDLIPRFDGRFRGYGKNKQSHAYHCAAMGFQWRVLPEAFVFAVPHPRSTAWKAYTGREPRQKMQIKGLYNRFKKEVKQSCLIAPPILRSGKEIAS